jgi:sulfate anion transporter 6
MVHENESDIITPENTLEIRRQIYTQKTFDTKYIPNEKIAFNFKNKFQKYYIKFKTLNKKRVLKKQLYNRLPVLKWLPNYKIRQNFISDLVSGVTIGIIQITQGMAYGLLALLPSVYGLYTSLFAGLVYWIFGTSHHISIGAYAVVSMLVGGTVSKLQSKYAPPEGFNSTLNEINRLNNLPFIDSSNFLDTNHNTALALIAASQCFWVGLIHFLMGALQLGFLSTYFSEPLVKGFTVASAFQVCTSQLKSIFGLQITTYHGSFSLIKVIFNKFVPTNFSFISNFRHILSYFQSLVVLTW